MPAIQLSRVRQQINELSWLFTQPEAFRRGLHGLFAFYADQVYRPGQTTPSKALMPAYRVPPLLIQQLELALHPLCQQNPKAALNLADELWMDTHFELRLVAAYLLGQLPLNLAEEVTIRLKRWCTPTQPLPLLNAVLVKSTYRLRAEAPHVLYDLAADWLSSPSGSSQMLGLKLLQPLIQDPAFENLPEIFNRLKTPLVNLPPRYQAEAVEIIQTLARRSPMETAYFLRQILAQETTKDLLRMVRKTLPAFPSEQQEKLQLLLKEKERKS